MSADSDRLLHAAVEVAAGAYAPYSRFAAGAAALTSDGSMFVGTNMENASYGLSMCAEVGALQSALAAGKHDSIVAIAVVGGLMGRGDVVGDIVTPCGRCRQLIFEASQLSNVDIEVVCADIDLAKVERFTISQLLPRAFGPHNLDLV